MSVYIELVIIDNFVLTYILAWLSYRVLSIKPKKFRCFVCSFIATAVAVWYPFLRSMLLVSLVRILLWVVLSLILFLGLREVVKGGVALLLLTLTFGGVIFGINFALSGSVKDALVQNALNLPLSVVLTGVVVAVIIVKKCYVSVKKARDVKSNLWEFTLVIFGKRLALKGFLDTGNRLYDRKSGLPIVVVNLKSILKALSDEQVSLIMCGKGEKIGAGARYDTIGTLTGESKILIIKPDEFLLYFKGQGNILFDVMVGITLRPLKDEIRYDAILHPALCA